MKKHLPLIIVLILVAGSIYYLESGKTEVSGEVSDAEIAIESNETNEMTLEQKAVKYERAKEIVQPGQFFNTENNQPITIQELIGKKVIMVDFGLIAALIAKGPPPYLNAWHDKYADEGLVILGLHSPEFDFEKDPANVQDAIDRFGIEYPVIQDNDFGTWRAYKNRYWPRKYLIDIDGFIVYDHIGEGAYDKTELKIQELLKERADRLNKSVDFEVGSIIDLTEPKKMSDRNISPETYFGASRNHFLVNAKKGVVGSQSIPEMKSPESGELQLIGDWDIQNEFAVNTSVGAKIQYGYHAHDIFMVLSAENPVRVKVMVDGKVVDSSMAGEDVDGDGYLTVQKEKLYKIIKGDDNTDRQLELIIEKPGLKAFTFTFG